MPSKIEQERADLRQADRHIAEGEKHVAEQELRIERLRVDGHDVMKFEAMLKTFQETLVQQRKHRELILDRLGQLGEREDAASAQGVNSTGEG